jgi:hypothetical protein
MRQIDILTRKIWWSGHFLMNSDALVVELDHDEDKIVTDDTVVRQPDAVERGLSVTRLAGRDVGERRAPEVTADESDGNMLVSLAIPNYDTELATMHNLNLRLLL